MIRNLLNRGMTLRSSERGFSLIELGIVVAVIGILATVVLVGRGFLSSSRAAKGVELIRTAHSGINFYSANHGDCTQGPPPIALNTLQLDGKMPTPAAIGGNQMEVTAVSPGADCNHYTVTFQCIADQANLCTEVCNAEQRNTAIFVSSAPAACAGAGPYVFTYHR